MVAQPQRNRREATVNSGGLGGLPQQQRGTLRRWLLFPQKLPTAARMTESWSVGRLSKERKGQGSPERALISPEKMRRQPAEGFFLLLGSSSSHKSHPAAAQPMEVLMFGHTRNTVHRMLLFSAEEEELVGGRRSCWARRRSELGWSKEDGALGIAGGCLAKKKIVGGSGFLNPFSCESFRENAPAPPQLFGFLHNWTLTPQTNQLFN